MAVGGQQAAVVVPVGVKQMSGLQHAVALPAQALPCGRHVVGAAQRRTPELSGTHGSPLQHWSEYWQTLPAVMQQPGRLGS